MQTFMSNKNMNNNYLIPEFDTKLNIIHWLAVVLKKKYTKSNA